MAVSVVAWMPDSAEADEQFVALLALHKANRAFLGPMPDTAFRDRAKHKGLLLGLEDEKVGGYLLYDIPRSTLIKLIHVCVDQHSRGAGLARTMVNAAIDLHPMRSLIAASCRSDYGIDGFWQSLGMHAASERPGRALGGSTLVNWVKRINISSGLDLLESASLESGLPIATLDTNIIGDLFSPPDVRRDNRVETTELGADWVQPLVTFTVSGEVDNEINANSNQALKTHLRAASQQLIRLSTLRPDDDSLENSLLAATDADLLRQDKSLEKDVLHIADAIHAGADYFVTNDANVNLAAKGWGLEEHGIRVVRPHELIAAISPQAYMSDFRSSLINDSDLAWQDVTGEEANLEPAFRDYGLEGKPNIFNQRLRELLAKRRTMKVQKLLDDQDNLWALAAFELEHGVLRVHLLRAIRGERGSTVAFQLLRHFRRAAWERGATAVEVCDPAISATIDAALRSDGFADAPPRLATLGPAQATAANLDLRTGVDVAHAERSRWPLVVSDARLPTYIIPIQPRWASRLFGLDDGLFSLRRRGLGLARELVYFSGSRTVPTPLPARVLWYASSDRTATVRHIVARSVITDATRVRAEEAIARYMRLGVYRKSDIESAASKSGFVNVIRFQDTELLSRRISSREAVFKTYVKDKVQSMLRVDAQMFDDVIAEQYLEGTPG